MFVYIHKTMGLSTKNRTQRLENTLIVLFWETLKFLTQDYMQMSQFA